MKARWDGMVTWKERMREWWRVCVWGWWVWDEREEMNHSVREILGDADVTTKQGERSGMLEALRVLCPEMRLDLDEMPRRFVHLCYEVHQTLNVRHWFWALESIETLLLFLGVDVWRPQFWANSVDVVGTSSKSSANLLNFPIDSIRESQKENLTETWSFSDWKNMMHLKEHQNWYWYYEMQNIFWMTSFQ